MTHAGIERRRIIGCAVCAWLVAGWVFGGAPAAPMPLQGATLRMAFGFKDKQPMAWGGKLELSQGRVVALTLRPPTRGKVEGNSWQLGTVRQRSRMPGKKGRIVRPVLEATLAAPLAAKVTLRTKQGDATFTLGDLQPGEAKMLIDAQVRVVREALSVRVTSQPTEDDWPAAATAPNGTIWVAYAAYQQAGPLDAKKLHEQKKFDSLKPTNNGDLVRLTAFDGKGWSAPTDVAGPKLDAWRPAVAVDGKGIVWVVWSQRVEANFDLYARSYDPTTGSMGAVQRLTSAPGADINVVAATNPKTGAVALVWQGWRKDSFDILTATLAGGKATAERALAASAGNEWCPAAAFDSQGRLHVAFDTYERGNYDVVLIGDALGGSPRARALAATPRYEARPSVAIDGSDRVWVAYEVGDVNWGKDTGLRWKGRTGNMLYVRRDIHVRCVSGDAVTQPTGRVTAQPVKAGYPRGSVPALRRISLPRIGFDGDGRLWLLYRRHPSPGGGGEIWASFATVHTGDGWGPATPLPNSSNVLDNRPALVALKGGPLLALHSSDYRVGSTRNAKQNDLHCTVLNAPEGAKPPTRVAPVAAPEQTAVAVHPTEAVDVKRVQAYRATMGGKAYRLLRGEFHRHTALTAHQDMDGTLEEMWRYAIDAASMDWIGNGDHENGYLVEYLWWIVQKQTDIYHHSPRFTPMFTYERSRSYPSGHRNTMFARRGIRPLPYHPGGRNMMFGTPEAGAPDIKTLYAYLRHFDGICASHTSGTNMGTDWRDNDPEVEPVVEIYQGLRQNYEHEGAPGSAKGVKDSIGGYKKAGFVWNAWRQGYKLGIQASSDHYSTHISYAIVYAEATTREAILDAFKKRHCYGANDNIILDVRCGQHMMGDIFEHSGKPTLDLTVVGTDPIARISIVRGVGKEVPRYVHDIGPDQKEVKLSWTDQDPAVGQESYYYVRVEQRRPEGGYGALAWASPMWITCKP